jgi:hypothetical protein
MVGMEWPERLAAFINLEPRVLLAPLTDWVRYLAG